MSEYTPEKVSELVAVSETWVPNECAASPVGAWHTIERLTDALTAVSAERDRLDESFDRDLPWRYSEVLEQVKTMRADRDRLHKAIESVEDFVTAHYLDTSMGEKVLGILRAALDKEGNDDE